MYKASLHLRDQEIQLLRQFDDTDDDITFNVDRRVVSEADADDEMCVDNLKDAGDCVDDVSNVHERVADQKSKN